MVKETVATIGQASGDVWRAVGNTLISLVTGIAMIAFDAGIIVVSGLIPDRVEPEFLKKKANLTLEGYKRAALQLIQDRISVVEERCTVKIDEDGAWVYTNKKGQTVRYPNGYPDFTEYAHPTVKPVEIKIASPTNRPMDYKSANIEAGLSKNSDPSVPVMNRPLLGYIWHHHQDGKTMILVEEKIHAEFTHVGGVSNVNKNR